LNLWNFKVSSPDIDLTDPDNLSIITTFTGTKDEEWFFMVSVAIEAKGADLITLMLNAIYAANLADHQRVTTLLYQLRDGLQELGEILERMYEKCNPSVFFYQLRPFLAGSKNMASAGLPQGVFYDLGGHGEWHQYSGGSNAQSSLIQTFDIFLGVEHSATGEAKVNSAPQSKPKIGYIQVSNYFHSDSSFKVEHQQLTILDVGHAKLHAWSSQTFPGDDDSNLERAPIRHELQSRYRGQERIQRGSHGCWRIPG
jgi:indoleamine 2,3-dioxygenase